MTTKKTSRKNWEEEVEAITVIGNIQAMQTSLYGQCFDFDKFNGNTLDELRNLQDKLIPEYNNALRDKAK